MRGTAIYRRKGRTATVVLNQGQFFSPGDFASVCGQSWLSQIRNGGHYWHLVGREQ